MLMYIQLKYINKMTKKIKEAIVRFVDQKYRHKDFHVNVDDTIFYNKKDEKAINPLDCTDYDINHEYYIYWRECGKMCNSKSNCCQFFKGLIISLGGM